MAIIKIKRGTTDPTAAQVTNIGELAANTSTPKLFIKTATDSTTTPIWVGATIEASPSDWTSASKLATQSAINTTFMPKSGGAFTSDVTLNAQSDLRFADSDSSNWVAFQGPATVAANVTWTLPSADGTNGQVLTTNGSGTLSWAGASATAVTVTSSNTGSTVYPVFVTATGAGVSLLADDSTGPLSYVPSTGDLTVAGDINVNGGDVITSAASATLFNTNATTLSVGGAATTGTFGYSSTLGSTTNISTGAAATGNTKTVNIGTGSAAGSTTNVTIGSTSGTSTVTIQGNLSVSGTTTTINTTTLDVQDKNITVGKGNTTDAGADGAGITADATSAKTFQYDNTNTSWTSSENMNIVTGKAYKIAGTNVLTGSALGSGVTSSSLTSVGTITSGTWNGTDIGLADGGTNASLTAVNGGIVYSGASAMAISAAGTSGQVLTSAGAAAPTWTSQSSLSVGTASTSSTITTTSDNTNTTRYLVFSTTAGSSKTLYVDDTTTPLGYNPSTNALTANALGSTSATALSLTGTNTNSASITLTGHATVGASTNIGVTTGIFSLDGAPGGLSNTAFRIQDIATGNGFYGQFNVASLSTASRTYTFPDATGTVVTTGNLTAITATGTIASGTWNGTAIGAAYGGTGQTTYTTGDILYASGSTAISKLSASSTAGAVLASTGAGAAPEYKTISFTNGSVTSGSGTLTLAVQNAAADGTTKGIAAFNSTDFDSASGVISIDTVDGGTFV